MKALLSTAAVLTFLCGFMQQPATAARQGRTEFPAMGQEYCPSRHLSIIPVNVSVADAQAQQGSDAETSPRETPAISSDEAAGHLKKGLIEVGRKDFREAERHFRAALKADPKMAEAAYNLGITIFEEHPEEALMWLKKAQELRSYYPKYTYTLASYTLKKGETDKGIRLLKDLIARYPQYANAYTLLGETYEKQGRVEKAKEVYRQAMEEKKLPQPARSFFTSRYNSAAARGKTTD